MLIPPTQISPDWISAVLNAAQTACRAIPPAFPLEATVAVNPFLGQTGEDLATASARYARVAGASLTRPRADYAAQIAQSRVTDDDLAAALIACRSPLKPADLALLKAKVTVEGLASPALPTVADLGAENTGTDWPALIAKTFGLWAAGHFDRGQALWSPAPGQGAFAAWRAWATYDLTPEIAGLTGFCAHVAAAPDSAERAILRAADRLGLTEAASETAFHRLMIDLGGWAQHARWLLWQAQLEGGSDATLMDLLAIRLIWEEALLAHTPQIQDQWLGVVSAHQMPVAPTADQVVDTILQDAVERAHQRRLASLLARPAPTDGQQTPKTRPVLQAAFCIDVRSEVIRRALEAQNPAIETVGAAGFFGLPLGHKAHGTDQVAAHLPVLLKPAMTASSRAPAAAEQADRIAARAARAFGRFRQAAVSSFAFVEAAGPLYGAKLVKDALGWQGSVLPQDPCPQLEQALSRADKAATAAAALTAMGLTSGFARVVLLVGHGASMVNNPYKSAYQCGACGGHSGAVSARVLATLLNDPDTRAGLQSHGITVPPDTLFLAALHDTTTDTVTPFVDIPCPDHAADLSRLDDWLGGAGHITREERARHLPGATPQTVANRASNWAETRPEWGLAGCAAFIAAPRAMTSGLDLAGRTFLHSYDWQADPGFATLQMILTAPVVVASWITLQYYGSAVAPAAFGGGNKLIHNVLGGIGVVEGNGGRLRCGLPWQAVHDGTKLAHDPLRLSVMVAAPQEAITNILTRHPDLSALFDNGWLHLFALNEHHIAARYRPGQGWSDEPPIGFAA